VALIGRLARASERLMKIEQVRWREVEIARNQRRPGRNALYPC
jgi:hypothetical protein